MSWLEKINKYLIYVLTIVFLIGSTAIITSGTILHTTLTHYADFFEDLYFSPIVALIIAGILLFCVAFLGCCGALKESFSMLLTLSLALAALMIMKVIGGVLVSQNPADVGIAMKLAMQDQQRLYVKGDWQAVQTWDSVQTSFQCCGVISFSEWINLGIPPPSSCYCNKNNPRCDPEVGAYEVGCKAILADYITSAEATLATNAIVFAAFEFVGVILAVVMAITVRSNRISRCNSQLIY